MENNNEKLNTMPEQEPVAEVTEPAPEAAAPVAEPVAEPVVEPAPQFEKKTFCTVCGSELEPGQLFCAN